MAQRPPFLVEKQPGMGRDRLPFDKSGALVSSAKVVPLKPRADNSRE
jgi:hypothetical protein